MSLDPSVAAVRLAVRRSLTILPDGQGVHRSADVGDTVMVACSGGADSLALLAATVFEVRRLRSTRVVGVVVDHALQEGSAEHTQRVVAQMATLGVDETASIRVTVDPGPAGREAGAREARYAALSQLGEHFGATHVLLGHTLDDQAETVLLGLTRGSGGRSLQGMRPSYREGRVLFARPMLRLTRAQTEAACRAEGIEWWSDPHNVDPAFARVRVRHSVLPVLERELGPGIAAALARTADQVREDLEVVEGLADEAFERYCVDGSVDLDDLDDSVPLALATRVLRRAAIEAGAIASELTRDHVLAVLGLEKRSGKEIQLPGHVTAYVEGSVLRFRPTRTAPRE